MCNSYKGKSLSSYSNPLLRCNDMATERRECSSLHFDFQFSVIVAIGGKGLDAESITKTLLKDKTYHLAAQLE